MLTPVQLTVLTTSRCTARCGHCSVRSGPERRDRLSTEQITSVIADLHRSTPLRLIIFAGGEPTLLAEDLLDSIAFAEDLGIRTRLITNASWAGKDSQARMRLRSLREAGLRELNISADDYHLPYIPFERVKTAWNASKGLGFEAVLIANCSGTGSIVTPEFIMQSIGERLPLIFEDDGYVAPLPSPATDGTVYAISNARIQLLGRAHEEVRSSDVVYPVSDGVLEGGCPWALRSPALSPQGHLVACCGMEAEGNEVLDLGDTAGLLHE